MFGMLTAVPALYRWIAIALLAVALFGYGYFKGRLAGEERLQAFVTKVEIEGREAQARAAEQTKKAKEITDEVVKAWDANARRTAALYDARLRDVRAAAGRVSDATPTAPRPHEFREPRSIPDTALRERAAELEIVVASLEKRLAKAAEDIEAWKDYGNKVKEWANANAATPSRSL